MYLWLTDYLRAKNIRRCSLYLLWEITIFSPPKKQHAIWMLRMCSSSRLISGGAWIIWWVRMQHQLLPDAWVAIVVRQSGITVLVALATPPSAHLYQVCERRFWEALSISCEYWQLEQKYALREKCQSLLEKINKLMLLSCHKHQADEKGRPTKPGTILHKVTSVEPELSLPVPQLLLLCLTSSQFLYNTCSLQWEQWHSKFLVIF